MSKVAENKIERLKSLSSDDRLAVLWFLYKDIVKDKVGSTVIPVVDTTNSVVVKSLTILG